MKRKCAINRSTTGIELRPQLRGLGGGLCFQVLGPRLRLVVKMMARRVCDSADGYWRMRAEA